MPFNKRQEEEIMLHDIPDESSPRKKKPWLLIAIAVVAVVLAVVAVIIFTNSSASREKSLHTRVYDAASSINVGISPIGQEQPGFEFHMNEMPPRFSFVMCMGPSDDSRLDRENWHVFIDQVLRYGPAKSYKPEFQEAGEEDGRKITRVMMYVTLHENATEQVAEEVAGKMMTLMREKSPCK